MAAFKVIGYMPSWAGAVSDIQFKKLTHVNYSFALPTASGGLQPIENAAKLQSLVASAHANGVKVFIAVGGWNDGNDSAFETFAASASGRTNFVNTMIAFVNQYNLDGVDIDWEYPDPGASGNNYTSLMQQLGSALHSRGKELSAAVVAQGSTGGGVSAAVFDAVDHLNIMAYDANSFDHATYNYAATSLAYWKNRGLPASKAIIGVPFYGRPSWESFAQLIARGASPFADTFNGVGYNGITTIKSKTHLAFDQGGGIMFWELSQDATGANSLVTAINEVVVQRQGGTNTPPTVRITAPANNTTYTIPANITVNATAADADGAVSQVAFYNGASLLGVDTTSPYSFTWSNVIVGNYSITARATDNAGLTATSTAVNVTVNAAPAAPNLALNSPVAVSSTEMASTPGSGAVDGNPATRWSSAYSDPQWLYVDLGSTYNINRVHLTWEVAYGRDYTVQVAAAPTGPWTTIRTVVGNTTLLNDLTGLSGSGRYVRINGSARGTPYGYSLWELKIYGTAAPTPSTNRALNRPVTVSSTEIAGTPAAAAVDGNPGTRWSSAYSDPQWIVVDLGTSHAITRVKLSWEAAYGRNYTVQTANSKDGPWTTLRTVTGNTTLLNDLTGLSGNGRYVRVNGTTRGTPYGYSLWELEVY